MKPDRDLIIIGGGAAGLTAAQYAARANLNVLLLEEMATGGQSLIIDNLENYPGYPDPLPGIEFAQRFEQQALRFGAEIQTVGVSAVQVDGRLFRVQTDNGPVSCYAVILATGAKHKKLDVPGEAQFTGRGVSYCATCDGPFFKGKRMLVVGGGDAACDEAMFLSNLTEKVLMIHRRDRFRAQKALAERVLANPHIEVRFHTELEEIRGTDRVAEVQLTDNSSGARTVEKLEAVFVFVGSVPQTQVVAGLSPVALDEGGYVITDQRMQTGLKGLFAAGDVRATPFRQLVVAAGEGAVAAHAAAQHIDEIKGEAYA
jgi:thioredoxin reductase (NADPH)